VIRSAAISLIGILVVFFLTYSSLPGTQPNARSQQATGTFQQATGTAFDNTLRPPAGDCASAIDQQWQIAANDLLVVLRKFGTFTKKDLRELTENERNSTARQKYGLRLGVLTQLAEKKKSAERNSTTPQEHLLGSIALTQPAERTTS
jgi:hypothetical protein